MKFSDKYGYTTPPKVLTIETMPKEVENAICSVLDDLEEILSTIASKRISQYDDEGLTFSKMELYVWREFLHLRKDDLKFQYGKCQEVATLYFRSDHAWYEKLNLLEFIVQGLKEYSDTHQEDYYEKVLNLVVSRINKAFEKLYYGYRIVNCSIVPITETTEIDSIQQAASEGKDNVNVHIKTALSDFAKRPEPDYRNSIKESISAVECLCREITQKSTLDDAIPVLKSKGVLLNPQFEEGLKKIYYYTNDKRTGIRHALMDDAYIPTNADAKYMLVICSAFVNYIRALIPIMKEE